MKTKNLSRAGERINAVEMLVDLGFFVFPLIRHSKKPITKGGLNDATQSLRLINHWDLVYGSCNWGVHAGKSGLYIIDVDKHKADGFASLEEAQEKYGRLPQTLTVETPTGGNHLYFRAPACVEQMTASTGIFQGVDIRCNNTYVVAPPSSLGVNQEYKFSGVTMEISDLPETWVQFLLTRKKKTTYEKTENHILQRIAFASLGTDIQNDIERRCQNYVAKMPIAISGQGGHRAALDVANVIFWGFALPP